MVRSRLAAALLLGAAAIAAFSFWPGPPPPDLGGATDEALEAGPVDVPGGAAGGSTLAGRAPTRPRTVARPRHAITGFVHRNGVPAAAVAVAAWPVPLESFVTPPDPRDQATEALRPSARPPSAARTVTDAAGRFRLEGLPSAIYHVAAHGDDDTTADAYVMLHVSAARREHHLDLDLAPAASLLGRLVGAGGTPTFSVAVLGASRDRLRAHDTEPGRDPPVARIAADGRFRLDGIGGGGRVQVWFVTADGDACFSADVLLPRSGEWVVHVPSSIDVVGRVVDATTGAGLAGAQVEAAWDEACGAGEGRARARTRDDGRFVVSVRGLHGLTIVARATGYEVAHTSVRGEADVVLPMRYASRVEVRVVSPEGTPVGDIRVVVTDPQGETEVDAAITDHAGRVTLELPGSGEWLFRVDHPTWGSLPSLRREGAAGTSWLPTWSPDHARVAARAVERVELVLTAGRTVVGRVRYADGEPAIDAHVGILNGTDWTPERATVTDAEGRFELFGVDGSDWLRLRVIAAESSPELVTVEADSDHAFPPVAVEVTRRPTEFTAVRVTDAATGAPIHGAELRVGDEPVTRTDPEGHARCVRPAGAGRIDVRKRGYVPTTVPVNAAAIEVSLAPGTPVEGRLVLEDGTPVAGARLSVVAQGGDLQVESPDAAGRFRFDRVESAACRVLVHAIGGGDAVVDEVVESATGPREVVVPDAALVAAGAFRVRVRDAEGNAVTQWSLRREGSNDLVTIAGTTALVTGEVKGGHASVLVIEGGVRADDGARLGRRVVPLPAVGPALEVVLEPVRAVEGRVVDEHGVGLVADVVISSYDAQTEAPDVRAARLSLRSNWKARADATGGFRVWDVPTDGCVLAADPPPGMASRPVRVMPGDRDVTLVLRRAPAVVVRALDERNAPVVGAFVGVHDRSAAEWRAHARTDADGAVRLEALDPSLPIRLLVDARDAGLGVFSIEEWRPRDETVRLDGGGVVAGTVLGPDGLRVSAVGVWWQQGEDWRWVQADEAGGFRLTGLSPGTVRLAADLSGSAVDASSSPVVEVAVGRTDLRLFVGEGDVLTVHLDDPGPAEPMVWFAAEDDDQHWYRPEVVDATTVRLRRCDPTKTYVVWSPPDGDGTVVCKRGLRAPGEVRVRRRPGGEIRVHVLDVDPGRVKVVASRGALEREGVRGEGGVFHVRGLPDGRLTIRVTADLPDGARVEAERAASIGDTIDVSLVEPRRR